MTTDFHGLREEVAKLDADHGLDPKRAFVAWYVKAAILGEEGERDAVAALTVAPDLGVDAVVLQTEDGSVALVQGKYREQRGKQEKRNDVEDLLSVADRLRWSDVEFEHWVKSGSARTQDALKSAYKRIRQGSRITLHYASTGSISKDVKLSAKAKAKKLPDTTFVLCDETELAVLAKDFQDGVAPPVPSLELISVDPPKFYADGKTGLKSYQTTVSGMQIARIFNDHGRKIFARNIRGFLGKDTTTSKEMVKTAIAAPDLFYYLNNGVTFLGRDIVAGADCHITIGNPQIINGQQTTRTLADLSLSEAKKVEQIRVPIRLIDYSRLSEEKQTFDDLVASIVAGTNRQALISAADLRSNDSRQIAIGRRLREFAYYYIRKAMSKEERRELENGLGKGAHTFVTKQDLALAVAGCELDPRVARSGVDHLFEGDLYASVFPSNNAEFYLVRYLVSRAAKAGCRKRRDKKLLGKAVVKAKIRPYMKWLVQNYVWQKKMKEMLVTDRAQRDFIERHDGQQEALHSGIEDLVERVFLAAQRFYELNKGKGEEEIDVSRFFRDRQGRHEEFYAFLGSKEGRKYLVEIDKTAARVRAALEPR